MDLTIYYDGELKKSSDVPLSIYDHGFLFGDGLMINIPVYQKHIFMFKEYYEDLNYSSKKTGIEFNMTEKALLKTIKILMDLNCLSNAFVTIIISRGEGYLTLNSNLSIHPHVFILTTPLKEIDSVLRYQGVKLRLSTYRSSHSACFDKQISTLSMQRNVLALYEAQKNGAYEGVRTNIEGYVCEGAFSNIFIVKKGDVFTPNINCGVTNKVMRRIVIKLLDELNIKLYESNLVVDDILKAEECFISSSEIGILPATQFDQSKIGNGHPGTLTNKLIQYLKTKTQSTTNQELITL